MRRTLLILLSIVLVGCAGNTAYVRPNPAAKGVNVKVVERSRDAVWNSAVPELGKQFFVINNLDKSSGLINISYTGDPERYIDCGRITSHVENARGVRDYNFPGSKAQQSYEIMQMGVGLFFIDRRMNLEGRVNLIFEEVGPTTTRVTANTRYVVTRTQVIQGTANNIPQTLTHSISFNSGGGAAFPAAQNATPECVATGRLEQELLAAIK